MDDEPIEASPVLLQAGGICMVSRRGQFRVFNRHEDESWHTRRQYYVYGLGFSTPGIGAQGTLYSFGFWSDFLALSNSAPLEVTGWPKFRGDAQNRGTVAFIGPGR
jgi:hypothetical protein